MSKLKKILLMCTSCVLVAAIAIGATLAYLTYQDNDVNVMTLGNVTIEQHEYERVVNADGTFATTTIDNQTSFVLKEFTQDKPLYPATEIDANGNPYNYGAGTWDPTAVVKMSQVGSQGSMKAFETPLAVDKFVTIENTGKSDAYVRNIVAFEIGSLTVDRFSNVVKKSVFMVDEGVWVTNNVGVAEIDGNNYYIIEYIYAGGAHLGGVHANGVLPAGETTYVGLSQIYMTAYATNEDCEAIDGNGNGTYDVLVFSQAVQAAGFDNADTALDTAFGNITTTNHPWVGTQVQFPGYVYNQAQLEDAINNGEVAVLGASIVIDDDINITKDASIDGNGYTIHRAGYRTRGAEVYTGNMFVVSANTTLELTNITIDGGAIWTGEVNPVLNRGTDNAGITAAGALISTQGNGKVILGEDVVLQNNCGTNAISLATRGGGSLTLNGAKIINNTSAAGAIWGGGNITINEGTVISNNHATSIGGAIRMVDGNNAITFTMNGGKINNNYSNGTGGAIWGGNKAIYNLKGGEIAYNGAASAGGAIWTGTYETYNISGTFSMHDNTAGELAGGIRFCNYASLNMTGGEIYNNTVNGTSNAFYLNNNSASITGGKIADDFGYSGGLGLTIGAADIDGVIAYNLATNHNTAYLASDFNAFKFTVNESAANFSQFNFKPAGGYTYTTGDEAKLICMNAGYETYWDATNGVFRLKTK